MYSWYLSSKFLFLSFISDTVTRTLAKVYFHEWLLVLPKWLFRIISLYLDSTTLNKFGLFCWRFCLFFSFLLGDECKGWLEGARGVTTGYLGVIHNPQKTPNNSAQRHIVDLHITEYFTFTGNYCTFYANPSI